MAATGVYKLDDGNHHPTNCFPARSLLQPQYKEGAGHWEVARHAAEHTKFRCLLGSKSTRVKWPQRHQDEKTLTGTLLMTLHNVKSPSHLCSADISNQNFVSAKEEDFEQFDSVAYMNATENLLTLEAFRKFPALRELELSLNGLRNLKVNAEDFPHLEILDLSYNNLSPEDIRALGVLPHLKALHLTANGLSSLPLDLAVPDSKGCPRFPALEVLLLDDNHLSHPNVFVSLANLRSLKQLNLDRNGLREVPYLHHVENSRFSIHPLSANSGIREGLRTRRSAEIQRKREALSGLRELSDYVVLQSSLDLDSSEVLFATCSPDPSVKGDTPVPRSVSKMSSFGQEFALPLMELRYLSLANNEIAHEEDLLAVALFPSLAELTFYGNPFTTSRSGDPPLLTSFLQGKLGIKLVRKKIPKLEKPRIFIPVKASRKVKSPLPKVRKRPQMLEAPLETTFWQLWTGIESDLDTTVSLDEFEPLPPISQFSIEKGPSVPPPPSREEEEESELYSVATFPSRDNMLELIPGDQTSLDDLWGPAHEVPSMLYQSVSASLPSRGSFLDERLTVPTGSASAEQDLSQSLLPMPERSPSETDTPVGMLSTEQERSELVPPPGSSGQGENPLERSPPTEPPAAKEGPSLGLQPVGSAADQPVPPPDSPSEPVPPTGFSPGEQDLPRSLPPAKSTSVIPDVLETSPSTESLGRLKPVDSLSFHDQELDLSDSILLGRPPETNLSRLELPSGPPLEEWDQLHLASSRTSLSRGESLSETVSRGLLGIIPPPNSLIFQPGQLEPTPRTTLSQVRDLLQPTSPPRSPTSSATQDQLESVPLTSSSFQERVLPDSVPPTGPPVTDQDLTKLPPTPDEQIWLKASPPSGEHDQMGSLPAVALTSPEPNRSGAELLIQSSSMQQKPPKSVLKIRSLPAVQGLADGASWAGPLLEEQAASKPSSRAPSSSRDLHLLFERKLSPTSLSRERLDKRSSSDSLRAEEMESFFMTQVEEVSDSLEDLEQEETPHEEKEETPHEEASTQPKRIPQPVPKRYRGYEELLHGPMDPDFIEPWGIHQNIKALEWALRHPLVYREPRARLDSFQKPYVPMEKKVLRVPVPPVLKTKAQELEELLQEMQTPTNIIELPLVCILRKKKSNWREYREALALLKDFRKKYKATVAREARPTQKRQRSREERSHSQMLRSLSGIKVSGPCIKVPPAHPNKEDKGL